MGNYSEFIPDMSDNEVAELMWGIQGAIIELAGEAVVIVNED